jgi:hypothetical protein
MVRRVGLRPAPTEIPERFLNIYSGIDFHSVLDRSAFFVKQTFYKHQPDFTVSGYICQWLLIFYISINIENYFKQGMDASEPRCLNFSDSICHKRQSTPEFQLQSNLNDRKLINLNDGQS